MSYKAPYTERSDFGPVLQRPSALGRAQSDSGICPWEQLSRLHTPLSVTGPHTVKLSLWSSLRVRQCQSHTALPRSSTHPHTDSHTHSFRAPALRPGAIAQSPGREAALAWASPAKRFPASSVLARAHLYKPKQSEEMPQ